MIMKKIIVFSFMVFSGVCFIQAGKVLDMLISNKNMLISRKDQISANRAQLTSVYGQLQNDLIGRIDTVINSQLQGFLNSIAASQNAIKDIPQIGLDVAAIGDIKDALNNIKIVLDTTKQILESVKNDFQPIVGDLSPADPQGIYKGFDISLADMNKALEEINKFQVLVEKLGL